MKEEPSLVHRSNRNTKCVPDGSEKKASEQEAEVKAANNAYLVDGIARLNEMKHATVWMHTTSPSISA